MAMDGGEGPSEPEEHQILGDCCRKLQEGWVALADSFVDKIYELSLDHWAGSAEIAKLKLLLSLKEREAQMNRLKNDYSLENALVAVVEKLQRSKNEKDDKIAILSRELDLLRKSTPVEDNTKGDSSSSKGKRGEGLKYQLRELQTWSALSCNLTPFFSLETKFGVPLVDT